MFYNVVLKIKTNLSMRKLSEQNKKVAICAMVLFTMSFAGMVGFLSHQPAGEHGSADVFHAVHKEEAEDFSRFDKAKEAVFVTDAKGTFAYINESFCRLLDYECFELLDENMFDHMKVDGNADLMESYATILQEGEKVEAIGPVIMGGSSGVERLLLLNAEPVKEKNKVVEIIFEAKDLTKQVKGLMVKR